MFLPLLECFLERTFCDGAQFSYRIFLNLHVFKKRPNFLNSAPTSTEGTLQLLSAPRGRFWKQTAICPISLSISRRATSAEMSTCTIRRTACARVQFSRCSSTTNAHSETGQMAVCCQNLPLGALSSCSATSVLVGAPFKKFGLLLNTGVCTVYTVCTHFNTVYIHFYTIYLSMSNAIKMYKTHILSFWYSSFW
jgi:hypothetical protein